jgi:ketosteroid isomerase-like protein
MRLNIWAKILFIAVLFISEPAVWAQGHQEIEEDFDFVLEELDVAIQNFISGDLSQFKDMWLKSEDVTISGGFGGPVEKGWDAIKARLAIVSSLYPPGVEFATERLTSGVSGNLGYLVQHEYFRFPDDTEPSRNYRVTMLFQNAGGEWKIIHRQADSNMTWQEP